MTDELLLTKFALDEIFNLSNEWEKSVQLEILKDLANEVIKPYRQQLERELPPDESLGIIERILNSENKSGIILSISCRWEKLGFQHIAVITEQIKRTLLLDDAYIAEPAMMFFSTLMRITCIDEIREQYRGAQKRNLTKFKDAFQLDGVERKEILFYGLFAIGVQHILEEFRGVNIFRDIDAVNLALFSKPGRPPHSRVSQEETIRVWRRVNKDDLDILKEPLPTTIKRYMVETEKKIGKAKVRTFKRKVREILNIPHST